MEANNEEFLILRQAIFQNFVAKNAPIKEKDLTLDDLCLLIEDVGRDYVLRKLPSKRGEKIEPVCGACGKADCFALACQRGERID